MSPPWAVSRSLSVSSTAPSDFAGGVGVGFRVRCFAWMFFFFILTFSPFFRLWLQQTREAAGVF